uniref:F-box-like family protein n=1 Tax=Pithovirus LCPAC401 TaxID=2506595 RepID=A0A481ZBP2_9VIRU|nr:MAG: uncharacterized protein LCPAC401_04000 [Pithovirus LCPAC401]
MDSISSDSLQTILSFFDVGEIFRKNLINHLFNKLCSSEALHKIKLLEDYSIVEKGDESWRKKTKKVYLESISFWNNVDNDIDYYMIDNLSTKDLVDKFEKKLIDYALRERKEFFVIKLIFKVFFINRYYNMYHIKNGYMCRNFISLFKKVASLSPQKKISTKWILDLVHEDYCKSDCEDECNELITTYPRKIKILDAICLKYDHLFINDISLVNWRCYI